MSFPTNFCNVDTSKVKGLGRGCGWPKGHTVTWRVYETVPGISGIELKRAGEMAWRYWTDKINLRVEYKRLPYGQVNVPVLADKIDGRMGVLAQAELGCGVKANSVRRLWLDEGERFSTAMNAPASYIPLVVTLAHEFGHTLGFDHAPEGSQNLMAPSLTEVSELGQWDLGQAEAWYGLRGSGGTGEEPKKDERFDEELFACGIKDNATVFYWQGERLKYVKKGSMGQIEAIRESFTGETGRGSGDV